MFNKKVLSLILDVITMIITIAVFISLFFVSVNGDDPIWIIKFVSKYASSVFIVGVLYFISYMIEDFNI